jgi:hypothetical protein
MLSQIPLHQQIILHIIAQLKRVLIKRYESIFLIETDSPMISFPNAQPNKVYVFVYGQLKGIVQ